MRDTEPNNWEQHSRDGNKYVLKFLPGSGHNDRLVKRFLQECRIATTQDHNNLVRVSEQGLSAGAAYYLMEYLEHGSLQELLTVYALVNAVTANLPVASRVQILVDGREVDTIAGHVDLRRPLAEDPSLVRDE